MANRRGKSGNSDRFFFYWALKSLHTLTAAMKLRHLLFGRKALINLGSVLKSRDITFLTKVYIVKAMVFPVVMYGYKSCPIKKAKQLKLLLNYGVGQDS